jgi:hypothetical protein
LRLASDRDEHEPMAPFQRRERGASADVAKGEAPVSAAGGDSE